MPDAAQLARCVRCFDEVEKKKRYIDKAEAHRKLEHYCAYQDRCHQEVRKKLIDLGCYGDDLEEVMAQLVVDNFLNEERFARSYARGKFRIKGWGRMRIKRDLKQKQISEYCIRKAMEELEEFNYDERLVEVILKKNRLLREPDMFKRKGKLAQFAMTKGFETGLIWETVKRLHADGRLEGE